MFHKKTKKQQPIPRRRLEGAVRFDDADADIPQQFTARTGYRRNQTVSSYKRTEEGESERQKSHHLVIQRRKLSMVFMIVAAVAVLLLLGLWQFIGRPIAVFNDTAITAQVDATMYAQTIAGYVERNPAQRFRATVNEQALTQYVAETHGEVASVSVSQEFSLPSSVKFVLTFRKPVAGWHMQGKQYYVDREGVVFSQNYFATPKVTIVDESGITPEQGSAVASTRLLSFLGKIVDQAGERGYIVTEATLPADTTRRVDVKLEGEQAKVRFSVDRGVGVQVEDMERALKFLQSKGQNVQYVDVRVAGRAAYK